jgi:hypothetical protein
MATRETNTKTSETAVPTAGDLEPSFPDGAREPLTADVQSMSFAGSIGLFNNATKLIRTVDQTYNTGKRLERTINGGNNRSPITSEQAENAFANEIERAINRMETPGFQNSSPRRQEIWATAESIKLERIYSKMERQSQERYGKLYNDIQYRLNEISSGQWSNDNPYDRNSYTANSDMSAEKTEKAFVTTLQKAYKEMNLKNFTELTSEQQSLWATQEALRAQRKYDDMSPDSQKIYRKNYVAFQNKLLSLGAQNYNEFSNERQAHRNRIGGVNSTSSTIISSLPSTTYEDDLWNS